MSENELLDFRKVMQQQIDQKVKPIAKEQGMLQAKKNQFILEKDHLIYRLGYSFRHSLELLSGFSIFPIYAVFGGWFCEGVPFSECEKMRYWQPRTCIGRDDKFTSLEEKEEVIRRFDQRLEYLVSLFRYCDEINSFEKYIIHLHQNIEETVRSRNLPFTIDWCASYVLGVYDCMQNRYEEGREKLIDGLKHGGMDKEWLFRIVEEVKDKDVYEIKNNDSYGLHCKFSKMFLDAIDSKTSERDENFWTTYEIVCNRMRKVHGMKMK